MPHDIMKVNLLAVVGGLLGVMCVLMPWVVADTESIFGDVHSEYSMTDFMDDDDSSFAVAVVLMLLGSALAIASPLGGMGMLFGWLIFLGAIYDRLGTATTSISETTTSLGLGFAVAVLALAMVLVALIRPMGPGYARGKVLPRDRFLTWSG